MNITKLAKTKKQGSALMVVSFISLVSVMLVASMSTVTVSNTNQITYDRDGKVAYYAAESGLAEITDFLNSNFINWGVELNSTGLPSVEAPVVATNGSEYWLDSLTYKNDNKIAIADIIGTYNGAYRKIRARVESTIPKYFDDYGLLTDGVLTINGKKILEMSIHGNDGLALKGPTDLENDSVATQSDDPGADDPDPLENPIGGYVEPIDVPAVPIDDLRTATQLGIIVDIADENLNQIIMNAPSGSLIYISNSTGSNNDINIEGNMGSKIIFIDDNISINAQGLENLSNCMIISAGSLTVNGSVDFITSHPDQIDLVFASEGDIVLNGSREYNSLFWTNGSFTQNGSSMSGRVISQEGITFNGSFTLTASDNLYDYGTFNNVASLSSWQQVAMDENNDN